MQKQEQKKGKQRAAASSASFYQQVRGAEFISSLCCAGIKFSNPDCTFAVSQRQRERESQRIQDKPHEADKFSFIGPRKVLLRSGKTKKMLTK